MKKNRVIIDCDVGIDDAMALALAFAQKKYKIDLLVASAGNLTTKITLKNTLDLAYYFKQDIPVAKGADLPLNNVMPEFAVGVHGSDGMGGMNKKIPDSPYHPLIEPACEAMYRVLKLNGKNSTDIWLIGPATNIALLLTNHKDAKDYIKRIIFMGASIESVANSYSLYNEFNVMFDPYAMRVVFDSGCNLVVIPMEIGHNCYLSYSEIDQLDKLNNKTATLYCEMLKQHKDTHVLNGAAMHDPIVVYYALFPKRFEKKYVFTRVNQENAIGQAEFSISPSETKTTLCFSTDDKKFKQWVFKSFKKFKNLK